MKLYRIWLDMARIGCGFRDAMLVYEGRKRVRVLILGSGEIVTLRKDDLDRAAVSEITPRRAKRAVKHIFERRRTCGQTVSKELREFARSI